MSFIVQNISLAFYDVNFRSVLRWISNSIAFEIFGIEFTWNKFFVTGLTIPVLLADVARPVDAPLEGHAHRPGAGTPMMGINVNRTISFTFALAGALGGAPGCSSSSTSQPSATTPGSSSG